MNLIQINTVINSGSTGRIAEEIGQLAIDNGWESYIAFGRNDRPSDSQKIKIGSKWDMRWHGLRTRLFDKHGLGSKRATEILMHRIKEIKPDIIHLHNIHGYYLNIQVLFNFLASVDIPIVWTFHDCWAITGHCVYFSFCGCERWKKQCFECPQKATYPASLGLDRSRENYELKKQLFTSVKNLTIVPVSKWLEEIVSQSFLQHYPIKTIHNGVNTDIFSPDMELGKLKKKYNISSKMILLGVASIWSDRKGLKDFVRLSERLSEDVSIVLVGLSEQQIKNLPHNIIGIKRTESIQELAELYNLADLFVNPTWEDNFPTTNLESLACGTPIVTYKTGGSVEAVTPETGFIVAQGDIDGLLQCVEEVIRKGKAYYSKACRDRALLYYKKEDRYAEYLSLYDEIINSK